jgi:hypothetical protein
MILEGMFPDVEAALIAWLSDRLDVSVYSELPDDFDAPFAPCLLVNRIPAGGTGSEYESTPTVEVTVFHLTRTDLWPLVQQTEIAIRALPGRGVSMIDQIMWPQEFGVVAYNNRKLRRAVATLNLVTRAQ